MEVGPLYGSLFSGDSSLCQSEKNLISTPCPNFHPSLSPALPLVFRTPPILISCSSLLSQSTSCPDTFPFVLHINSFRTSSSPSLTWQPARWFFICDARVFYFIHPSVLKLCVLLALSVTPLKGRPSPRCFCAFGAWPSAWHRWTFYTGIYHCSWHNT